MENGIQIQHFTNQLFGSVRTTIDQNGNPWFAGVDVASCLGYSNTRDALSKHVLNEDKNTVAIHDGIPGNPNIVFINESGLYSLIFGSKLPSAIEFKHWVTSEVLPTMRKVGFNKSMQLLEEEVMKLREQNQGLLNNNFNSGIRASESAEMRVQMIDKIRSVPTNTPLTEDLKQFFIQYDPDWEG